MQFLKVQKEKSDRYSWSSWCSTLSDQQIMIFVKHLKLFIFLRGNNLETHWEVFGIRKKLEIRIFLQNQLKSNCILKILSATINRPTILQTNYENVMSFPPLLPLFAVWTPTPLPPILLQNELKPLHVNSLICFQIK